MITWRPYDEVFSGPAHAATGELWVGEGVESSALPQARRVVVRLPSGAAADHPLPVLFMMDGENVFNDGRAYSTGWRVDDRMDELARDGINAIVVAIDASAARDTEYVPYDWPNGSLSRAAAFLGLVIQVVIPAVEDRFAAADPAARYVMGASFGGTISLEAVLAYPGVFAGAALMSPSLWPVKGDILAGVARRGPLDARIWIDVGTRELSGRLGLLKLHIPSRRYTRDTRRLHRALLTASGENDANVRYVEVPGARHNEAEWSARFPDAVRFLLPASST